MQKFIALLIPLLVIPSAFAHNERRFAPPRPFNEEDFISDDVKKVAQEAMAALGQVRSVAAKRGISVSDYGMRLASDIFSGYYAHKNAMNQRISSNIVWITFHPNRKKEIQEIFAVVTEILDPKHGLEWVDKDLQLAIEPRFLETKIREQRKHLVVMDDILEMNQVFPGEIVTPEIEARLARARQYFSWIQLASKDLTIFALDNQGVVHRMLDEAGQKRINFTADDAYFATLACDKTLMN